MIAPGVRMYHTITGRDASPFPYGRCPNPGRNIKKIDAQKQKITNFKKTIQDERIMYMQLQDS